MYARQNVIDVILGKHDLCDLRKNFRLILLHPEDLGRGKARKGNVCGQSREFLLANFIIKIINLLGSSAVVPSDRRTDHIVVFIQRNQTVHLTTSAYARHQTCLKACKQFGNALKQRFLPILWVLLAPTRLGEFQRILFGDYIMDLASSIHQQKLHGRSAQVNPNVIAHHSHPLS